MDNIISSTTKKVAKCTPMVNLDKTLDATRDLITWIKSSDLIKCIHSRIQLIKNSLEIQDVMELVSSVSVLNQVLKISIVAS